ncbi:MAG: DRTGG domain-containing protein [Armatimonadetes bacterium]|nr:DRTGG domain-containing protein [Armatimonadota bacterium]
MEMSSACEKAFRGAGLTLAAAMEAVGAEALVPAGEPDRLVTGCFAADLMSDVLAFAQPGCLLITGLAKDQAVRSAAIKNLAAVLVVGGKEVDHEMIEAAQEEGVPLYRTGLSKYEACGVLMQAGYPPCGAPALRGQEAARGC